MSHSEETIACLSCGRSENEVPVLGLRYSGEDNWICSGCLPTLIHNPQRLAGKLAGAEALEGVDASAHHHDAE